MSKNSQPAVAAPSRPGLRERKMADVRRTILRCAKEMFVRQGYDETSMTAIADAANISRKTLFNYVSTKESIILAMIDEFIGEHMPEWLEADLPFHHDVRDILTPTVSSRLDAIAENRWLLTLAAQHTDFFAFGRTKYVDSALRTNLQARARRIAIVQKEGGIRTDVPPLEISLYYEALRDQVVRNWLLEDGSTPKDLHRKFRNAMAVLQKGLEPDASPAKSTARRK